MAGALVGDSNQSVGTDLNGDRLALGTVQFGVPYGIANQSGMVTCEEMKAILTCAYQAGLNLLDTAISYGESEERLGKIGVSKWEVVSKIPPLPDDLENVPGWIRASVTGSLDRLGLQRLQGILLHRPTDLLGRHGVEIYETLQALQVEGLVESIGVSIYGPDELEPLWRTFPLDLVQAPYNVIDHRIVTSGWLARLCDSGVSVHARSAFLQGLLLMAREQRPGWSQRWNSLWDCWHRWLDHQGVSALEACLGFVLANRRFERVVVGVDNFRQLEELLSAAQCATPIPPNTFAIEDLDLIDPSRWSKN